MNSDTVINTSTRVLLDVYARRGFDADKLLLRTNTDASLIQTPHSRLKTNQMWKIWQEAYAQAGENTIGMEAAQILPIGAYGVLDYLLLSSPTLWDLVRKLTRYYRLINSGADINVEKRGEQVLIELNNPPNTPIDHMKRSAEYTFAVLLQRLRLAAQQPVNPSRIEFVHRSPQNTAFRQKLFQTNLRFNQKANKLIFDKHLLEIPLPQADGVLLEMLEHRAGQLLSGIVENNDLAATVRQVLLVNLKNGNVSINATARALAMSVRNLQRELSVGETSYQAVLDRLRCELAVEYLSQNTNLRDISYQLGFSESSAFSRAFKKWTGKTPQTYHRAVCKKSSH